MSHVVWKFLNIEEMAVFMRKNAVEAELRAQKQGPKEAALTRREAYVWRECARVVDDAEFEHFGPISEPTLTPS